MGGKRRMLIVDDNVTFHQLIDVVFGETYELIHAHDGGEGLKAAKDGAPDVILLDVMMPKVSGIEMLRGLQSDPDTRKIPVLILTGSHFDPTTQGMFEREPNVRTFLQKPCGADILKRQVAAAIAPDA